METPDANLPAAPDLGAAGAELTEPPIPAAAAKVYAQVDIAHAIKLRTGSTRASCLRIRWLYISERRYRRRRKCQAWRTCADGGMPSLQQRDREAR